MPKYDYTYLMHFACFSCRKVYKQPPYDEGYKRRHKDRDVVCPQCGDTMVNMGRNFKAPKQDDIDQWATVELLYRHDITTGPRPTNLKDAQEFLGGGLVEAEAELILRKISRGDKKRQKASSS